AAPPPSLWSEASAILGHPLQFFVTGCRVAFQSWPLVAVLVAFAVLVRLNGGVALGDRSAHEARLHSPQALYFLGFCVAMHPAAAARLVWAAARAPSAIKARWIRGMALPIVALSALACLAVSRQSPPDILYLAASIPTPLANPLPANPGLHRLSDSLLAVRARSCLFRLALLGCSALALVPASLIEPRYFIAPWLLWRLSAVRHDSRRWLLAEAAYFAAVNAAVYWLFLRRPFLWPGVPEEQRFVW
uniref:Dol-P-Glc:Glc(2)Man(9)GlcNAc(2)-PP-Dol alpha-1,2-glucosyltransferase n=1 Tax=Macrostomum lignano TaxID=282301 RepID=A0A1I8G7N5_9PLAT